MSGILLNDKQQKVPLRAEGQSCVETRILYCDLYMTGSHYSEFKIGAIRSRLPVRVGLRNSVLSATRM